jgi:hypothetical protein
MSTNNKPVIYGTDDAIWDRIRMIPFTRRFSGAKADTGLPRKLRAELPGVLAWMVRGCLDWQHDGLGEPKGVKDATAGYRAEMDALAAFFEDRCVVHPKAEVPATPLYKAYQEWCADNGEADESQRRFGGRLRERGFVSFTYTAGPHMDRKGWRGIGLRDDRHGGGPGGSGPPPEQTVTPDDQKRASSAKRDQGAYNTPETGAKGPGPDDLPDDCPGGEVRIGTGNAAELTDGPDDPGRKNNNSPRKPSREEGLLKKGPEGPVRPVSGVVTPRDTRKLAPLVRAVFEEERSGPAKNLRLYRAGQTTLAFLTNSVLGAMGVEWGSEAGMDPVERRGWEQVVASVADEGAA